MKTLYFIKDIRGNEFYWRYRIDEGFTKEIKEALKEFIWSVFEEGGSWKNRLIFFGGILVSGALLCLSHWVFIYP